MSVDNAAAGSIYVVMSVLIQSECQVRMTVQTIDLLDER